MMLDKKEEMSEVAKILGISKEEWIKLRDNEDAIEELRQEARKIIKKEKRKKDEEAERELEEEMPIKKHRQRIFKWNQ